MKNSGLMAVLFFLIGLLLMWCGIRGRNPIRVIRDVLTNGSVGQWNEYKNEGGTPGGAVPPPATRPPSPPTHGGTLHA